MYAVLWTRPDLCYAVNLLSRYRTKPSEQLWKLLKRVLRYVKGTLRLKLAYSKFERGHSSNSLLAYVDVSYATNDHQAHSTSGTLIKLFGSLVFWSSHRQSTVALSTTIAEFNALCEITRDIIRLRQFLETLGIKQVQPTTVIIKGVSI